jgi:hypothetical protein
MSERKELITDKILERRVKQAVKERLNTIGAYHFWPVQMGLGAVTLDCLGCRDGRMFAIECKRPGGKVTARQELTINAIRAAGGEVFVIDSIEAAKQLFT